MIISRPMINGNLKNATVAIIARTRARAHKSRTVIILRSCCSNLDDFPPPKLMKSVDKARVRKRERGGGREGERRGRAA